VVRYYTVPYHECHFSGLGGAMGQKVTSGTKRTKSRSVTVRAAWIAGGCAVLAAIITAVAPPLLSSGPNPSPTPTLANVASAVPTTSASAYGLDVQSSIFLDPGIDSFFVTKNTFQPTGQVAATFVNAPDPGYLSIFHSVGAINQGSSVLRLIFTGESKQGIRILNIAPIILKRAAPWHGDLFEFPLQGIAPTVQTNLNLDDTLPVVTDGKTGQPYFANDTITLRQGEQEVVIMRVTATQGYVAYTLRVDYLVGTQQHDVIISDQGKPFELSAVNCIRKDVESYGAVFTGRVATVSEARLPSQLQSNCTPN
jgi:hypothetical protein